MRRTACALILLLAACASTRSNDLRVLVYNIHAGKDAGGVDNLERVAAIVRSTNADLVLLQEVDRNTRRSGNVDQLETLTRLTGLHGAFGKSLDYDGGLYGIATLSRWPIAAEETIHLPVDPPQTRAGGSHEPRVALIVTTATPTGPLTISNTHLDASGDDHYRLQEIAFLLKTIASRHPAPLLAGGDFNSTPDNDVHTQIRAAAFRDAWRECGSGPELTYPAKAPVKRIDYLYLGAAARCTAASVLDSQASDHRAVLVTIRR